MDPTRYRKGARRGVFFGDDGSVIDTTGYRDPSSYMTTPVITASPYADYGMPPPDPRYTSNVYGSQAAYDMRYLMAPTSGPVQTAPAATSSSTKDKMGIALAIGGLALLALVASRRSRSAA